MIMKIENYSTSDWYLCVFLIAKGYELLQIDRTNKARCQFIFTESRNLHTDVENFWHNGEIGVQDFVMAVKKAKALLHSDSF